MDGVLRGITVLLPQPVMLGNERFDLLYVIGCDAGIGVRDEFRQVSLIGRHTENGFAAPECFVELSGQHAMCVGAGEHEDDAAAPNCITQFIVCEGMVLRGVKIKDD